MGKTAYIFPGQGAQVVGMGKDLYQNCPAARDTYNLADEILGYKISELCFEGPLEELTLTKNVQPALLATSIAIFKAAEAANDLPPADFVAGHSLGEYTALVAGGSLELWDALTLVVARATLMEEAGVANPGGMLALIGADRELAEKICSLTGMEVSNLNSPQQVVISGPAESLETAVQTAAMLGVRKAIPLKVSGAFHSSLMKPAADGLAKALASVTIKNAAVPLLANSSARPITSAVEIHHELEAQLLKPVLWQPSVEYMSEQGVDTFIEFGPGNVLSGLIKRILPEARLFNVNVIDSLKQKWS
ncbi:MAG: ACP S-malonyltransferase [Dehalococcoidales bacterium]|jgi:[acyl-carrier-protein] S-malonyltransferase|nr:ACP S-malonyltransferase [Dehalococcoidales bacterium]MDD4230826.1 ACP S-malonyltransferase [Dehalococcoidales bacterium]MDD4465390.1 ACP S-malonyltransferase [Dehalococcoidales bacterium]MDD5402402.1 ACP S-malonyltransferase [Dehalococcoidales bacterium]